MSCVHIDRPEVEGPQGGFPLVASLPDPDNEYFSDGLAEALIDALNRIPGLEAAPRTSTWQFKGANLPAQTIADSIGVSAVLAGSVRRAGDDIRISIELVSGKDGARARDPVRANGSLTPGRHLI
jgi:TolB-like protein